MANYSKSKANKSFIALIVAIVLVLAATAYVIVAGFTSAVFSNTELESAVAMALDKREGTITKSALSEVKYLELASDTQNLSAYIGYDDFLSQREKYVDEQEAIAEAQEKADAAKAEAEENGIEAEEIEVPKATVEHPVYLAKSGVSSVRTDMIDMADLGFFTGAKVISITAGEITSDTLSKLTNLTEGSFVSCEFDSLSGFSKLDLTKIDELVFQNCSIADNDWTVLHPIAEKVTISSYGFEMGEDGNYTIVPITKTLKEQLDEEAAAKAEAENAEVENAEAETEGEATVEGTQENDTATQDEVNLDGDQVVEG